MAEPSLDVEILWQHDTCCVINKPGGVLTQAPPGIDSLELRLRYFRKQQTQGQQDYVGVPHRLDRPASGAMVFGWNRNTTRKIASQFEARRVAKKYWTVVEGTIHQERGTWQDMMRKVPDEARSEIVADDHPDGQLARLTYQVLGNNVGLTWIEIELETGRTHQIRLQAGSRGWPILGDSLYGSSRAFGPPEIDERARWIALHSRHLEFEIPRLKQRQTFTAPLPNFWKELPAELQIPV